MSDSAVFLTYDSAKLAGYDDLAVRLNNLVLDLITQNDGVFGDILSNSLARSFDRFQVYRFRSLSEEQASILFGIINRKKDLESINEGQRFDELLKAQEQELESRKVKEELRKKAEREKQIAPLRKKIIRELADNFLAKDKAMHDRGYADYGLSEEEYSDIKIEFIKSWASESLNLDLSSEQALAVAALHGDVRVTARAGSGKTRTIITRTQFLNQVCGVEQDEILMLAFNRDAAKELRERVGEGFNPHVMTFHALAWALVHPEEDIVFDKEATGQMLQSRLVQNSIDEHLREDGQWLGKIKDLMLSHFRSDWEGIVAGRYHFSKDEFLRYRRSLRSETLRGEYVKSFGERHIANTLFEHGIEYEYERNVRWEYDYPYRPDFVLKGLSDKVVVIEYFGMAGDPDYDKGSFEKREFWSRQEDCVLLEYRPVDIMQGGPELFSEKLILDLREQGIIGQRLNEDEIWEKVKGRSLDRFTGSVKSFVARCRKKGWGEKQLSGFIAAHRPLGEAEQLFLEVGSSVYLGYCQELIDKQKEDFDGLMIRAVQLVKSGASEFKRDKGNECGDLKNIKYVMIDEFQDFTDAFQALVYAIISVNPDVQFFCVGDDWQSINGFAGSDLGLFHGFGGNFRDGLEFSLSANYRSPKSMVTLGNRLMKGFGSTAIAVLPLEGWVRECDVSNFRPSPKEHELYGNQKRTPALCRLIKSMLSTCTSVVMLCRKNSFPWRVPNERRSGLGTDLDHFLHYIRLQFPEPVRSRISISSVHSFKGRESEGVIVIDAEDRNYPLIHPTWFFYRLFGDTLDTIESEEKRLFYVAISRAKNRLALLTNGMQRSPYLEDLGNLPSIDWSELPSMSLGMSSHIEIRVQNGFDIKDQLKSYGFRFNGGQHPFWSKVVVESDFDGQAMRKSDWYQLADGKYKVEVVSEGDQ